MCPDFSDFSRSRFSPDRESKISTGLPPMPIEFRLDSRPWAPGCQIYRQMIYLCMLDEPMRRLLDYDHRRYWLVNGWSVRFRIAEVEASVARPHGIKYSFTYDNAHGVPRAQVYDHRHRFRQIGQLVAYEFRGADELL